MEENSEAANLPLEREILLPGNRDSDTQDTLEVDALKDPDRTRQDQASTKVQAAFRGYLVNFTHSESQSNSVVAVKICCLCLVIGLSSILDPQRDNKVTGTCSWALSEETKLFLLYTLLASSPIVPLCHQYDTTEPNSVLNWLERWSESHLWEPIPQLKKVPGSKSQKKQGNPQTVDTETGKVKQGFRRNPHSNLDHILTKSTFEIEKLRCSFRKVSSHPAESVQEHPQNELEKVKRNLRKIQNPNTEGTVQSEIDIEKPKCGQESIGDSTEKIKKESSARVSKQPDIEATLETSVVNETIDYLHNDQTPMEPQLLESSGKDETILARNRELSSRESLAIDESQKSPRKVSSSAKHEHSENGLQNKPTLPSYMAAKRN
ncbi:protein IQ-DOMAIN 31-like [Camellia sinensis]|nr:protein IQ-DOMAIN 31-like [Camellia sinensis]